MSTASCERCRDDENRDGLVFIRGHVYCNYHADREYRAPVTPTPPPEVLDEEAQERSLAFKYGGAEGYQRYLDKQADRPR